MGADASRENSPIHSHGLVLIVQSNEGRARPLLARSPSQSGEIDDRAIREDNLRFDPVCPVAGDVPLGRNSEEQLLCAMQVGFNFVNTLRIF